MNNPLTAVPFAITLHDCWTGNHLAIGCLSRGADAIELSLPVMDVAGRAAEVNVPLPPA